MVGDKMLLYKKNKSKMKKSFGEKFMLIIIVVILLALSFLFLFPLLYVFSMSVSNVLSVARREVFLLPKGFDLDAYQFIIDKPDVWRSYYNTIWYTGVGTLINVTLTMLFAYPLSQKEFFLRKQLTVMMALTMWFSGGLIPTFMLMRTLGLYNTRWVMVLLGAILPWNVIITRTYLQGTIPDSLIESAKIDGAHHLTIFRKVVLPLSKPIIAVNALFYAVGHWNEFFKALVFINNKQIQPLQIFLRNVLFASEMMVDAGVSESSADMYLLAEKMKYSVIVFAMLPILMVYPFIQKYFVKGVMIGSVKG
jgi:putative aldouronate transport system permease protein